jgi:hypothetical protein
MSESDTEMAASIADDTEMAAVVMGAVAAPAEDYTRDHYAVCTVCKSGAGVTTERRRPGISDVVERHTCTNCESYGASVITGDLGDRRVHTEGDVVYADLSDPANETYVGTF